MVRGSTPATTSRCISRNNRSLRTSVHPVRSNRVMNPRAERNTAMGRSLDPPFVAEAGTEMGMLPQQGVIGARG